MSRRKIKAGSTSVSVPIFVQDTSSTTGAGLGSLVYNTSSLAARYRREGDSSWTSITLATMTLGTWASGGFVTSSGVTGKYEFGVPNAALASGKTWCEIEIYGATNMLPVLLEFELDAVDYQDSVRAGLTALPNAAHDATGGVRDVAKINGVAVTSVATIQKNIGLTDAQIGTIPTSGTISTHTAANVAAAVEAAILDEGDATALLAAIAAKVEDFVMNDGDSRATLTAIATAVNTALTTAHGSGSWQQNTEPNNTGISQILTKLGTPADTDLATDIANVATAVGAIQGSAGAGARTVVVTVIDDDTEDPIEGVTVRMTAQGFPDSSDATVADGTTELHVDDAAWKWVATARSGYESASGTIEVNGPETLTIRMTSVSYTVSPPGYTTCLALIHELTDANAQADGAAAYLEILKIPDTITGLIIPDPLAKAEPDVSGNVEFPGIPYGATCRVRAGFDGDTVKRWYQFTARSSATTNVAAVMGVPVE